MNALYIEATHETPLVSLNPDLGEFSISGKSIIEDAENFYQPILDWFSNFSGSTINLVLDLEFFNISSSKRILYLLYKLNDIKDNSNANISVKWIYQAGDEDMHEVGQDYAYMVNIPFELVEVEREMA